VNCIPDAWQSVFIMLGMFVAPLAVFSAWWFGRQVSRLEKQVFDLQVRLSEAQS
jgi:hypothetical protein